MVLTYINNKSRSLHYTIVNSQCGRLRKIKYLLCQGLYTMNQDSPLNKEGIKID
jgi:hypothetical protein